MDKGMYGTDVGPVAEYRLPTDNGMYGTDVVHCRCSGHVWTPYIQRYVCSGYSSVGCWGHIPGVGVTYRLPTVKACMVVQEASKWSSTHML